MKRIEKEFNALTGKETITERDETPQEQVEREAFVAKLAAEQAEAEAKATARASAMEKLAGLGLTTEEIAALTK